MAIVNFSFYSESMRRPVPVKMILSNDAREWYVDNNPAYNRPMRTLFLLHGYSGDDMDWITGSDIVDEAYKNNIAVVLPNAENAFYVDAAATGHKYGTFLGRDLVNYVRKTFGLAQNKNETYVGGFSMGGFGAIHTALMFPDVFCKGAGLSSANIVHGLASLKPGTDNGIANYEYYEAVFGDLSKIEQSDHNPEVLVQKLKEKGIALPKIFMACGTEDFLLNENRATHQYFTEAGVDVTYHESAGAHNMIFWNEYLSPMIKWMLAD